MAALTLADNEVLHALLGAVGAPQPLDGALQNILLLRDPQSQRLDLLLQGMFLSRKNETKTQSLSINIIVRHTACIFSKPLEVSVSPSAAAGCRHQRWEGQPSRTS